MDVFALFSDKTAEKVLLDSFPSRETEKGLVLKTTINSSELKKSAITSINNAYLIFEKLFNNAPERIGICVYGFSSSITGNSADLAFAVAFLVHLVKKDIIEPYKPMPLNIAATGIITERLTVERISNIKEKVLAAVENKVEVVLYPFDNQNELEELKNSDADFAAIIRKIHLIPLKSLEDVFYELGLMKNDQNRAVQKPQGRKLPIALFLTSATLVLAFIITLSVLNKAKDQLAFTKTIPTPEIKTQSSSPTQPKIIVYNTSKTNTKKSSPEINKLETPVSTSPTITPKLTKSELDFIEDDIPKSHTISSSKTKTITTKTINAETKNKTTQNTEIINTVGNISANLMNSGFVASQGGWIYFTDHINIGLYKMKNDSSSKTRIQNAFATHLNVSEGNIYYIDSRSRGLFTIKSSDTEIRKINDDNFGFIYVSGNWIYYLNKNDNLIYRVYKNGLDRTPLCSEFQTNSENLINYGLSCSNMCVDDDYIYFYAQFDNKPDSNGIYRMKTNGLDKQVVLKTSCEMLTTEDGYIYYIDSNDNGLFRVRINGTGKEKIHENVKTFNLASGLIYFSTGNGLFKMNYNGDFISKLCIDSTNKINIVSNWIYYFNSNDANRLYRIRPNGIDKQCIG